MAKPEIMHVLVEHTDRISALAFSPHGRSLASGSHDKRICLWNVSSGKKLFAIHAHASNIKKIYFNPDGNSLASYASSLKLWNRATGQLLHTFQTGYPLALSPHWSFLASAELQCVALWKVADTTQIGYLYDYRNSPQSQLAVACPSSLAFSPNGQFLVCGSSTYDTAIRVWTVANRTKYQTIPSDTILDEYVSFRDDGHLLILSLYAERWGIKKWNIASASYDEPSLLQQQGGDGLLILSRDGRLLANGGKDGKITIWDVTNRKLLYNFAAHTHEVSALAFSDDKKLLASGSVGYRIKIWEI